MKEHSEVLNAMIDNSKDNKFSFFGVATLEKSYLLRDMSQKVIERPQYMYLRVAIELGMNMGLAWIKRTYEALSNHLYTHATPTLFNSGTRITNLASCFQSALAGDSHQGITKSYAETTSFSRMGGGNGLHTHALRAAKSLIGSSGRPASGLFPFAKQEEIGMRYFNQNGKRPGALSLALMSEHAEFPTLFPYLKRGDAKKEDAATDLFYQAWVSDRFMEAAERGEDKFKLDDSFHTFCPHDIKKAGLKPLQSVYGAAFDGVYEEAIKRQLTRKAVSANAVMNLFADTTIMEGMPYWLLKDAFNRKSNYKHAAPIESSNLCAEMAMPATSDEWAETNNKPRITSVCNLASGNALELTYEDGSPNHANIDEFMLLAVRNLDAAIDKNSFADVPSADYANTHFRPLGIGIQGLGDVRLRAMLPFESPEWAVVNKRLSQAMYYYALKHSCELAKEKGAAPGFAGSPMSEGKFQFDLWQEESVEMIDKWTAQASDHENKNTAGDKEYAAYLRKWVDNKRSFIDEIAPLPEFDWEALRANIKTYGLRNIALIAYMPTASTANIMGNLEGVEDLYKLIYVRETFAGDFTEISKWLVRALDAKGLWNAEMSTILKANDMSVKNVAVIPSDIREVFKTVWEHSQMSSIDQSAVRGAYTCHSQSFNLFYSKPNRTIVKKLWIYAWRKGLKTGMYYLKSLKQAKGMEMQVEQKTQEVEAVAAVSISPAAIDPIAVRNEYSEEEKLSCSINAAEKGEDCMACSS